MRILYLHQYFKTPDMQGGTRSYEMARRMVAAGHEVHMITSRNDVDEFSSSWDYEQIEGIHVHWLPVPYGNDMSYSQRIRAFFQFALKAGPKAIAVGGDIIFATSTPLTIAIPAVKAKKHLKVPMVFEVRDLWPELPIAIGALKSPLTKGLARRLERYAYFNAEHIVGLSPGMSDGVIRTGYPAEQVSTVPNSCDLDLFQRSQKDGEVFRQKFDWLGDRPLVLYAGTLGHINGVAYFAELAAAMHQIDDSVRFLIIGEGVEHDKVKARANELGVFEKNLFMLPSLPKKDIPDALAAATVCTSLFVPLKPMWANSANKFFDALAAGKPVAINYGGWQAELISKYRIGVQMHEEDAALGAQQLNEMLQDKNYLRMAGQRARKLAEEEFSRDRLAGKLIGVLENNKA